MEFYQPFQKEISICINSCRKWMKCNPQTKQNYHNKITDQYPPGNRNTQAINKILANGIQHRKRIIHHDRLLSQKCQGGFHSWTLTELFILSGSEGKTTGSLSSCSKDMSQYPMSVLEKFFTLINRPVETIQLTSDQVVRASKSSSYDQEKGNDACYHPSEQDCT